MTQPQTDLAYLHNEKAKAEQKLRSCQHREKILERQMSELNRRERVHRLCTRAGMLESFLVCPGELTDDQVMELLKISFRQPDSIPRKTAFSLRCLAAILLQLPPCPEVRSTPNQCGEQN